MSDPTTRKLVLIVDDSAANITMIASLLKDAFRTRVSTSGEKALVIAAGEHQPDLILLDVEMPGMNGYEVCRKLKDDPRTADIPIIFLTARADEESEAEGLSVGGADYIRKPFAAHIVLARVNTQIALRAAVQQAQRAEGRADRLLRTLLPPSVADEINTIGTVIPRRYENVAVLFADVVNFTGYCDTHEPEEVISRLDALFLVTERVVLSHGLEKIKTVGDAFMAAAGLLNDVANPLESAVRCGLDMVAAVEQAALGWELRVGVSRGPLIAGVVGQERYQFDIWGDTVNMAARLTSKPQPGRLAVSAGDWACIAPQFEGRPLGELEVKGKGLVSVYEVIGARPSAL